MLSHGILSRSQGAGLFEVLIKMSSSLECCYVREMQESTKSLGGTDTGEAGGKGELHKRDWLIEENQELGGLEKERQGNI